MPFCAVGKLFFTDSESDYVASAAIYGERELLLTAAHCVCESESGMLYDHFLFKRCYQVNERGKESCSEELTLKTVALKEAWIGAGNDMWRWDYAIAVISGRSCLAAPLIHGQGNTSKVRAIGYPSNYYDGKKMVYVEGAPQVESNHTLLIYGDKMGAGCSGGPWVDDSGVVAGVNSYSRWSRNHTVLDGGGSPILDEKFESLYKYVLTLI